MIHVSLLFWLALAIPGYAAVCHFDRDQLKSGLLGTLGLSYVATLGLLSPISILCYVLGLPLAVFSSTCVLLILAGSVEVIRNRWWRDAWKLIIGAVGIELLIVVVDMVMGAGSGAMLLGDALVHLARIRFLLDHGLNNLDPYCAVPYLYPIYHTNILHALYASATQLTGGDHLVVWAASLPWGKLLIACGAYYLVWSIFQRQWPAWVAAVFVVGVNGPVTFIVYPNKLAPYWLAAYMIGFAVQACRAECSWRACIGLAAGALALGQLHGLYALATAGVIAPVLGIVLLTHLLRRHPDRWRLAACVVAVGLVLPFPVISKLKTRPPDPSVQAAQIAREVSETYVQFDNGWVMANPRGGFGGGGVWSWAVLGAGLVCAVAGGRRREAGIAAAIVGVAAVVFYVPPICSAVLDAVGREWILSRCGFVLRLGFLAFGVGAIAFALESRTRFWWVRALLSLLAFTAAFPYAGHTKPYDWSTYCKSVQSSCRGEVKHRDQMRKFLEKHVPPGATVLSKPRGGMYLVMLHDCHIVAAASSSLGVTDLAQRHRDVEAMLSKRTPWPLRRKLLRRYGIQYYFPGAAPHEWTKGHIKKVFAQPITEERALVIIRLDVD